jgi:acyl-CoA thioesterase
MTDRTYAGVKEYFQDTYKDNSYVKLLDMKLDHVEPGMAEISMFIDPAKHTNLYHVAHGGALASIADTAMGVACGSVGRRVVTLELNMNFIKAPAANTKVMAVGRLIHNGRNTIVADCEVAGGDGSLMLKARGTFYVVGQFDLELEK